MKSPCLRFAPTLPAWASACQADGLKTFALPGRAQTTDGERAAQLLVECLHGRSPAAKMPVPQAAGTARKSMARSCSRRTSIAGFART